MGKVYVSKHAIDRYRERVADLSDREIIRALTCPTIKLAVSLGAPAVKLPAGQHVMISGSTIITVLPKDVTVATIDRFTNRQLPSDTGATHGLIISPTTLRQE
jgi:hypothetical protein